MWCNNIDFVWIPRTRNEKHFSVFVVFRLFFVFVRSCPCVCVCMCVTWFGFDDVFLCCHCIALHHNVRTYVRSRTENKNLRKQTTENDKSQLNDSTEFNRDFFFFALYNVHLQWQQRIDTTHWTVWTHYVSGFSQTHTQTDRHSSRISK